MVSVLKDCTNPPAILLNENRVEKLQEIIQKADGNLYSNTDYAPKIVKETLEIIYKKKCAFCESKIKHAASLEVEHYRPKAALTYKVKTPNGKEKIQTDTTHKGYYWLGLEWSNLLLSCPTCNNPGAKGNQFPIKGIRILHPPVAIQNNSIVRTTLLATNQPLASERPLLLNPEISNPHIHFFFDSEAKIYGITDEGRATIEICRLNREDLIGNRQELRLELKKHIDVIIEARRRNMPFMMELFEFFMRKAFQEIDQRQYADKEYSLWGWYMFHRFEKCFLADIDNSAEKEIILNAYKLYRQGKL